MKINGGYVLVDNIDFDVTTVQNTGDLFKRLNDAIKIKKIIFGFFKGSVCNIIATVNESKIDFAVVDGVHVYSGARGADDTTVTITSKTITVTE